MMTYRDVKPEETIFAKFAAGQILKDESKVYEDEHVVAFKDLHPVAPVHVLVISKDFRVGHVTDLPLDEEKSSLMLGRLLSACGKIAVKLQLNSDGYRIVINQGSSAGQSINYLHVHILGKTPNPMSWPPL